MVNRKNENLSEAFHLRLTKRPKEFLDMKAEDLGSIRKVVEWLIDEASQMPVIKKEELEIIQQERSIKNDLSEIERTIEEIKIMTDSTPRKDLLDRLSDTKKNLEEKLLNLINKKIGVLRKKHALI